MKRNSNTYYEAPVRRQHPVLRHKGRIAIVVALFIALGLILGLILAQGNRAKAVSQEDAKAIAADFVPDGASYLAGESNDSGFQFKWFAAEDQTKYQVELTRDGEVHKVESERLGYEPAPKVIRTKDDVARQFETDFPGSTIEAIELLQREEGFEYEVSFTADGLVSFAVYDAGNAQLVRHKMKAGSQILISLNRQNDAYEAEIAAKGLKDIKSIEALALQQVPGAEIKGMDLEETAEQILYEVSLLKDNLEYLLILDAHNGDMISLNRQQNVFGDLPGLSESTQDVLPPDQITLERAEELALAYLDLTGQTITNRMHDEDDSHYLLRFQVNDKDYRLNVHSRTGKVTTSVEDDDNGIIIRGPGADAEWLTLAEAQTHALKHLKIDASAVVRQKSALANDIYTLTFVTKDAEYKVTLRESNGEILSTDRDEDPDDTSVVIGTTVPETTPPTTARPTPIPTTAKPTPVPTTAKPAPAGPISSERALQIALARAGVSRSSISDLDIELDDGAYEVEFDAHGKEYSVDVRRSDGRILVYEVEIDD